MRVKPLSKFIKADRFVGKSILANFGLDPSKPITASTVQALQAKVGAGFVDKGFVSASYNAAQNVFTDRPIRMEISARAGIPDIVTNNHKVLLHQFLTLSKPPITFYGGIGLTRLWY